MTFTTQHLYITDSLIGGKKLPSITSLICWLLSSFALEIHNKVAVLCEVVLFGCNRISSVFQSIVLKLSLFIYFFSYFNCSQRLSLYLLPSDLGRKATQASSLAALLTLS